MKTNFSKKQLIVIEKPAFVSPLLLRKLSIQFSIRLLGLIFIISTASCNKMDVLVPVKVSTEVQGFKSLVTNDDFIWEVMKSNTLNVIPLQTESDISATLYVKTLSDHTLLTYTTTMQQALQLNFDLPTDQTKVKIIYGSIQKIVEVTGNQISFDFISPIPAQYE
jgi:hypothetical protein